MVKVTKTYVGREDRLPAWADRLVSIVADGLYAVLVRKAGRPRSDSGKKRRRRSAEEPVGQPEKGRVEVGDRLPS
jgi:hypothetical protein